MTARADVPRTFVFGAALLVVGMFALQSTRLFVDLGTDGFHYYAARLVADGLAPHRDFFFGAAPGRALVLGALLAVGVPVWVTKLLTIGAMAAAAVLVGLIALRHAPVWAALVAVLLAGGSSLAIRLAPYQGGHGVAAALVMGAALLGLRGRWRVAGALASVAMLYDLSAFVALAALVPLAWRRAGLGRFVQGLSVLLVGFAGLYIWLGEAVFAQTVVFSLLPTPDGNARTTLRALTSIGRMESAVVALSLGAFLRAGRGREIAACAWLLSIAMALPLTAPTDFVFAVMWLSAAAGIGANELVELASQRDERTRRIAIGVVGLFLVATVLPHLSTGLSRRDGKVIADARIAVLVQSIAARVPPSGRIWGDSAVAPAVAFRAGLRIAGQDFDTSDRRVTAGMTDARTLLKRAFASGSPGVLLVHRHGIARIKEVRELVYRGMALQFIFAGGIGYKTMYFVAPDVAAGIEPTPQTHLIATPDFRYHSK